MTPANQHTGIERLSDEQLRHLLAQLPSDEFASVSRTWVMPVSFLREILTELLERRASDKPSEAVSFFEMLADVRSNHATSKEMAAKLGISAQYLNDIEHGRKAPSQEFVERICQYLGRGPKGRREWHVAAAKANGWEIDTPLLTSCEGGGATVTDEMVERARQAWPKAWEPYDLGSALRKPLIAALAGGSNGRE